MAVRPPFRRLTCFDQVSRRRRRGCAFFRPSEIFTKQRGTNKMKESPNPVKAQNVHTAIKKSKDLDKPAELKRACRSHSSFCDTKAHLAATNQQPSLMHFLTQHAGPCDKLNATIASSQSFKKRKTLSPGPCNPMTGSASLHTLSSPETLEETLSSSDHASPSLSRSGLFGQPNFHASPQELDNHSLRLFPLPPLSAGRQARTS